MAYTITIEDLRIETGCIKGNARPRAAASDPQISYRNVVEIRNSSGVNQGIHSTTGNIGAGDLSDSNRFSFCGLPDGKYTVKATLIDTTTGIDRTVDTDTKTITKGIAPPPSVFSFGDVTPSLSISNITIGSAKINANVINNTGKQGNIMIIIQLTDTAGLLLAEVRPIRFLSPNSIVQENLSYSFLDPGRTYTGSVFVHDETGKIILANKVSQNFTTAANFTLSLNASVSGSLLLGNGTLTPAINGDPIDIFIDAAFFSSVNTDSAGNYSFSISIGQYAAGDHTVQAKRHNDPNVSSGSVTFHVEGSSPGGPPGLSRNAIFLAGGALLLVALARRR